jgi:hypothetical protein
MQQSMHMQSNLRSSAVGIKQNHAAAAAGVKQIKISPNINQNPGETAGDSLLKQAHSTTSNIGQRSN